MTETPSSQKPHYPHLDGYQSPAGGKKLVPGWVFRKLPDEVARWIPRNWRDIRRMKISARLWMFFDGRIRIERFVGMCAVGLSSYLFLCWLDGVSPYLALSEDPNTAFQHPHWIKVANERAKREREMRRRLESSDQGGMNSMALEHATKSYASNQGSDRAE